MTEKKKPAGKSKSMIPMQRNLMEFPTFWPVESPGKKLVMERVVMRDNTPVKIKVILSSETELPEVKHRHYLDALVKKFVILGKPKDNRVPVNMSDIFADRGVTRSGYNYLTFFQAVLKYKLMNITFFDAWPSSKAKPGRPSKKAYQPKTSGRQIITAFDLENPSAATEAADIFTSRKVGWVEFSSWFADSLRADHSIRLLDQQILANLNVGYSYRVFEYVSKMMGERPVWEINLMKLGLAIPFVKEMDVRTQVQAIKRVLGQLEREKAFASIKFRGRGDKTIVTFQRGEGQETTFQAAPEKGGKAGEDDDQGDFFDGDEEDPSKKHPTNYAGVVSNMVQLMTQEAKDQRRASKPEFVDELKLAKTAIEATLGSWSPAVVDAVDAFEETRLAYREGKVTTSVRQFFLDKLRRYHKGA